ncbi:MAG: YraN family protein [Xanthomonadales bacterium]|nr:YraN family protein [Xanthomonadales bacterium]
MTGNGRQWERRAANFLRRRGLQPLTRNYRCRFGEIDLVMTDGDTISFVEVRYRSPSRFGSGAESIGSTKRQRLIRAARHFLGRYPQYAERPCRFDVVSISGTVWPRYEWIRNAFES